MPRGIAAALRLTKSEDTNASGQAVDLPIRTVRREDTASLKAVISATGLFPSEMLEAMLEPYFESKAADDVWLTYDDGAPIAIAYHAPEKMTSGTRNLLLIAVHPTDRAAEWVRP